MALHECVITGIERRSDKLTPTGERIALHECVITGIERRSDKAAPVDTTPLRPMTMPCGVIKKTLPVEESEPKIDEGSLPVTRFNVAPVSLLMLT